MLNITTMLLQYSNVTNITAVIYTYLQFKKTIKIEKKHGENVVNLCFVWNAVGFIA